MSTRLMLAKRVLEEIKAGRLELVEEVSKDRLRAMAKDVHIQAAETAACIQGLRGHGILRGKRSYVVHLPSLACYIAGAPPTSQQGMIWMFLLGIQEKNRAELTKLMVTHLKEKKESIRRAIYQLHKKGMVAITGPRRHQVVFMPHKYRQMFSTAAAARPRQGVVKVAGANRQRQLELEENGLTVDVRGNPVPPDSPPEKTEQRQLTPQEYFTGLLAHYAELKQRNKELSGELAEVRELLARTKQQLLEAGADLSAKTQENRELMERNAELAERVNGYKLSEDSFAGEVSIDQVMGALTRAQRKAV